MKISQEPDSLLPATLLNLTFQRRYGFDDMDCHMLAHNISDVYILEDWSSKYIFKIYQDKHRNLEEIEAEIELLNILHQRGAKVSYPITDQQGHQIQKFQTGSGLCYGVLFSYAQGKVCFNMNDQQLVTVGREMAVIHEITSNLELKHHREEFNLDTLLLSPLQRIKPAFKTLEKEYDYLQKTAEMVIAEIEAFDLSLFSYGYCHYDLLPVNFHFEGDENITFFDFDHAGKGYLINDIISFYAHYFLQMMYGRATHNEAAHAFDVFITSYRKNRSLTDAEIEAVSYFGFAFWVYYIGFDYDHFDDRSSPGYLKQQVDWITKWVDWYIGPKLI